MATKPPSCLRLWQDDIVPLTSSQIAAFKPYTWYAATTDCNTSAIMDWSCGQNCNANPTFKSIATGGDGEETSFWFSGYDPTLGEVIVSHEGTDFEKPQVSVTISIPKFQLISAGSDRRGTSILQNVRVCQVPLDSKLFPGIDQSIRVHKGYAGIQSRSAPDVIAAVEEAFFLYPTRKVTVVGHSLGAAVALLNAVYLSLHLPSDVTVRYIGYASPRVGNQAFADYVDALGMSVTRINNKQDPVPIFPPKFLKYYHVSGEVHIRNDDVWVSCPGQDNPSDQCSTTTASIFKFSQHTGPFDGVSMGECRAT